MNAGAKSRKKKTMPKGAVKNDGKRNDKDVCGACAGDMDSSCIFGRLVYSIVHI